MLVTVTLLLVFANGYAAQRGNICVVAAANELVHLRRAHRFVGFLLCAALALVMIAAGEALGFGVIADRPGFDGWLLPAIGGTIFAVGALINGKCAFGTVARLGTGDASKLGTIAGFLGGAAAATVARPLAAMGRPTLSMLAPMHPDSRLVLALALAATFALAMRFVFRPVRATGEWSPLLAMSLIGLLNGLLLVTGERWPYTTLLIDLAGGSATNAGLRAVMAVVFVGGAALGAVVGGTLRLHLGSPRAWARASIGGFGMGMGASLVPGGNDAMLLVGLPLLLPNLVIGYIAMNLTLVATIAIMRRASRRTVASDIATTRG